MEFLILMAIIVAIMYFMMIRPQKRRMEERQALLSSLVEGQRIMLTSGIFGTILHLGEQQAVIELAPGAEITVRRDAILKTVEADEEEFEFADDVDVDEEVSNFPELDETEVEEVKIDEVIDPDKTDN